jgi:hypothetical protein
VQNTRSLFGLDSCRLFPSPSTLVSKTLRSVNSARVCSALRLRSLRIASLRIELCFSRDVRYGHPLPVSFQPPFAVACILTLSSCFRPNAKSDIRATASSPTIRFCLPSF